MHNHVHPNSSFEKQKKSNMKHTLDAMNTFLDVK